jgi:D-alanine-D-alanine ligase
MKKKVEETALKVFKLFGCRDYARVDLRIDRDGKVYVLEVNPNPDISPQSGMNRALKVQGVAFEEFVRNLIERALHRKNGEMKR